MKFDPDWLERQYNNRARVPESAQILARWAEASAQVRQRLPAHLDLAYGSHPTETLDVFLPSSPGKGQAPVLFFVHGGWWRTLDKSDHSWLAPTFCESGAVVVVPNYALCPAVTIEHIALQMTRALAWTWRHASQWGADPRRLVVAGHSAGGHLSAMLLSARWDQVDPHMPAHAVTQAVSLSGVFDLEPLRQTPFLQRDLRLSPASVQRLSPVRFPPPAGALHAWAGSLESDEFLRHNRLIQDHWGAQCVPTCQAVPGCNHFTILDDFADPRGATHRLTRRLLMTSPRSKP
jgi:arylformamidase